MFPSVAPSGWTLQRRGTAPSNAKGAQKAATVVGGGLFMSG